MIENRFVTSESTFVDMSKWDACVDPSIGHVVSDRALAVYVGVDASVKHDATAIVAVTFERLAQRVRLVTHKTFVPTPTEPIDFEIAIEGTLLDFNKRFQVRKILFDPYQMQAVAQRLTRAGLPIEEFPQSPANLTAASQNLYELIEGQNLVAYRDAAIRLAISRAIAVETPRGWRIAKEKASHRIDVVVALGMAAYAAVQAGPEDYFSADAFQPDFADLDNPNRAADPNRDRDADIISREAREAFQRAKLQGYMRSIGWTPF
jgi:phage terminase large subunit-like protein